MKKRSILLMTILLLVIATYNPIYAQSVNYKLDLQAVDNNDEVTPRKDVLKWYFKSVDGRLYKRQYNHTQKKWVTDWILV